MAFGILRVCNVSWYARNIANAFCAASPEAEKVMLEICRDP
jgi:hypothetical protein